MGIIKWLRGSNEKETRASLSNPTDWLRGVFTGSITASGERVSTDSALRQPAVFACVRVISEDVASLPCKVYAKDNNGGRQPIDSHPVARLLHTAPNPEMTPFTFKETMTAHILLHGNAYAEIERNGAGDPIALWVLMPDKMQVKVIEGEVWYEYDNRMLLPSEKVLHIRGLGHDGILGYSPISYARETIGISQAMEKSGGNFFANSSRPSGVLSHPARLSEDASKRLRQGWDGMYSGSDNLGKTAILEEGMKFNSLSIPHSDAQWLEARQYALQDIARIYRMPPHMIGDLSRATFSNIESQQIAYMQQTLMPWLRRWEQEINKKLIGVEDRSVYAEFLAEEMLRGNTSERFAAYRTARETGWMSVNEIRTRENMNPVDGGDSYIQPLNFADVDVAKDLQTPDLPADRAWLSDSINRAVGIVRNASNRKANKVTDAEWQEWLSVEDKTLQEKVQEILEPACRQIECQNGSVEAAKIAQLLLATWRDAIAVAETREKSVECCDNWARSFTNEASANILLERSFENEQ